MTKTEKKKVIKNLISEFHNSTDISKLTELKESIVAEILSADYDLRKIELVKLSCNVWSADIQDYINKLESGKVDKLDSFTELAFAGLYNLVDMSVLQD